MKNGHWPQFKRGKLLTTKALGLSILVPLLSFSGETSAANTESFSQKEFTCFTAGTSSTAGTDYAELFRKKKKSKKGKNEQSAPKTNPEEAKYKKLISGSKTTKGMFTTHFTKENKLYWEMPEEAFRHLYILANRVDAISNVQDFVSGQMINRPLFIIRFTKDNNKVYIRRAQTSNIVDSGDPITDAFNRNNTDPVLKAFKIAATNGKNVVIDVTPLFASNESWISPIKKDGIITLLFGGKRAIKGVFMPDASGISSVKTFPKNIEIKSMLCYTTQRPDLPYTVNVHRSLFVLPDRPMQKRYKDNRVGFFSTGQTLFSTSIDGTKDREIIHRWRVEPKEEDKEKYFRGELVEPAQQIVFYVDTAFPKKWRPTVHQGIEDWNKAFEKAGFKNVVKAVDYPSNDPDFDPEDMRYNCIKYAVTETPNAMGPSHVDPRTGEILTADVIWYHNILKLLHNWRFTQTGAVDPRTHAAVFPDDLMCESLRYAVAHEVGHTMGLMHNMGASYAFPVDSLRNPGFTQKYGTTPSIMDYARNNFIAQPGDVERGVKLTPPVLGVYDIYAINWGYRLIPGADTPEKEIPTLNKWIAEKLGNPMYEFGAQQVMGTIDPTDQTEDLGNDHIKAGDYAISNLKIIMKNLTKWVGQPGETYADVADMYKTVVSQYARHLRHLMPYLGGVQFYENRQGDQKDAFTYIDKATQKKAMLWLVNQARTYNSWLTPQDLIGKLGLNSNNNSKLQGAVVVSIFNGPTLFRVNEGAMADPKKNYSVEQYLTDAVNAIFVNAPHPSKLSSDEMALQDAALNVMMKYTGLKEEKKNTKALFGFYDELMSEESEKILPCQHIEGEENFTRINYGLPQLPMNICGPLMSAQLKRVRQIYNQRAASAADTATREFYKYQVIKIDKLFKI